MKEPGRIQATLQILQEFSKEQKPMDFVLHNYLKTRRYIGSKDRQYITTLVYALLRNKLTYEWWVTRYIEDTFELSPIYWANLVCVHLLITQNLSSHGIQEIFTGEQYAPPTLDQNSKAMIKEVWQKKPKQLIHQDMPSHIQLNTPSWIFEKFQSMSNYLEELTALSHTAPTDIRINTLKSDMKTVEELLKAQKVNYEKTPHSEWGLRFSERLPIHTWDIYKNGHIEIQDEGSQLLVSLIAPEPGMTVIDYCAGAGGKSLAMAMMMQNKGRLILCDTSEWRLKKSDERIKRAGVSNIQKKIVLETADGNKFIKRLKESADIVLTDAPCSGTGTWRRNPDLKWRSSLDGLTEIISTQKDILQKAATLVKPGGILAYATCSMLAEENEKQIEWFLNHHEDFSLDKQVQFTPYQHQTDGFFLATMKKK